MCGRAEEVQHTAAAQGRHAELPEGLEVRPRIKALIAQTPSETILLSRIYERCQPRHSLKPVPAPPCVLHSHASPMLCKPVTCFSMQVSQLRQATFTSRECQWPTATPVWGQ